MSYADIWAKAQAQQATKKRSSRHIEDDLQIACVNWFSYQYPKLEKLLHHSPNGGKRDAREAARFKTMGVRPGFPDLILLHPSNGYHFLCIELKTKTGKQSDYQKEYQKLVEAEGGKYVVCRTLEEFIAVVKEYLKGE
jgi:hypothetical protein